MSDGSSTTRRAAMLPVAFFGQDASAVARGLLGCVLHTRLDGIDVAARIVETEAYLGARDPGSHAFAYRRTPRNEAMFAAPGTWYVYRSYGIHWCANLTCGPAGEAEAVLLRALEPLAGVEAMVRRRATTEPRLLCSGPGRLCQALGIDKSLDATAMRESRVVITHDGHLVSEVAVGVRIGLTKAADWPERYGDASSRHLSRPFTRRARTPRR